jgi:hypothetical protein
MRKIAVVAGAGAVATMTTLALNPFSASAVDAPTATTTTVTGPATATAGHAVKFVATVAPFKMPTAPFTKATGTVTFTIVGSDSSAVACAGGTNARALSLRGTASCKVSAATLSAAASPYSVTAVYSGDGNFVGSSNEISQTVEQATTHITLTFAPKVASATATVVTATLTGSSGLLPTGKVHFVILPSLNNPTKASMDNCSGKASDDFQVLSPNAAPRPKAVVTCQLSAGWFNASSTAKTSTWAVEASYNGDGNFGQVQVTKTGSVKG